MNFFLLGFQTFTRFSPSGVDMKRAYFGSFSARYAPFVGGGI
jgi:hypothetical protein|nr:MAG TPA: hypothetical protein [Caudoviricetes sp.]